MTNRQILVKVDTDLQDIIPGFLQKREHELPLLKQALKTEDFHTLQALGHNLKGMAGGYGFDRLGELGSIIEEASKKQDCLTIQTAIEEIESYISNVTIEYQSLG